MTDEGAGVPPSMRCLLRIITREANGSSTFASSGDQIISRYYVRMLRGATSVRAISANAGHTISAMQCIMCLHATPHLLLPGRERKDIVDQN